MKGLVVEAVQPVDDRPEEATLIVIDRKARRAHSLGAASSLVFRLSDGKRSIAHIAAALHETLGLPEDESIVTTALDGLARAGLVERPLRGARARVVAPTNGARRALLKQLATSGMLALTTLAYLPRASAAERAHRQSPRSTVSARTHEAKSQVKIPSGPFGGPDKTLLVVT